MTFQPSIDQMARILYEPNSYEVEKPKFEVGDWVTRNYTLEKDDKGWLEGHTFQIVRFSYDGLAKEKSGRGHSLTSLRPSTKEEIMWAELGREVGKFQDDDYVVFYDGSTSRVERNYEYSTKYVEKLYKKGNVKGFYPVESFIKFP